jgi:hypothetical protein
MLLLLLLTYLLTYLGDILHSLQVDLSQRKVQYHLDTANQGTQSQVQL